MASKTLLGKIAPYEIGDFVKIRIGGYKGQLGTVTGFSSGHPRQWVMVRTKMSESLMFDWDELERIG